MRMLFIHRPGLKDYILAEFNMVASNVHSNVRRYANKEIPEGISQRSGAFCSIDRKFPQRSR